MEKDKKIRYKSVMVGYTKYRTLTNPKFENRKKWELPDESKILAFIPGKITEIKMKEGDMVKKGDTLFELEAMKMYNQVMSNRNGKIKKIHVQKNQVVIKNQLLLELELI
ncbi:acetyl-CoA carboxylase biotin carboxyl carrier protein subunit [Bacteroidota bacterium]